METRIRKCKMRVAQVLITAPVDKLYDYMSPEGLSLEVGDYVLVPVGTRSVAGVVWSFSDRADVPVAKLKTILQKYDVPSMTGETRAFLDWVAKYNMALRGAVLKMAIPVLQGLEPPQPLTGYILREEDLRRDHPHLPDGAEGETGRKIVELLSDGLPRRLSELSRSAGVSASVIKTLVKRQVIQTIDLFAKPPCGSPDPQFQTLTLSPEQRRAASAVIQCLGQKTFETFLLDGVTGAGKTEVYFEAVAEGLRKGQQALILLPEIALSNAFIARFRQRFGMAPALWHSSLTPAQRRMTWWGIVTGRTKVVVGARSALFLPYAALGLIVVDEEHDPAFKQEEGICYNARDMAVMRGFQGKVPVVLASATPSLETMQNVWDGRYTCLQLPDRFGGADKPEIRMVDLRVEKPERQHFISPPLKKALSQNLDRGQQSLLFLNRRGFAPLTLCRGCGHRMECPRCTAWLVEHKRTGKLQCHHCGFETRSPEKCPSCQESGSLVACGPGVERIAEEVKEYFPFARFLILASDVTDTHEKLTKALGSIQSGEVDIIIGTQIIAKGHHFPNLTCVGIVDADLGLSGGDLRATERSFQLLHQVAGRAGRESLKGTVYLQTYNPEQRVMQLLAEDDRDQFLRAESAERQRAHMPPFSRLAAVIVSGGNELQTAEWAGRIGHSAPRGKGVRILGPAPAQLYKIRGKYRQRLLVQADKTVNLQKLMGDWLAAFKVPSSVRVQVDIDPQSFV